MADTEAPLNGAQEALPSEQALALEEEEKREDEEKKKSREPPIVYKDFVNASLYFVKIWFCNKPVHISG